MTDKTLSRREEIALRLVIARINEPSNTKSFDELMVMGFSLAELFIAKSDETATPETTDQGFISCADALPKTGQSVMLKVGISIYSGVYKYESTPQEGFHVGTFRPYKEGYPIAASSHTSWKLQPCVV
jgi:hypothetical protein